jgi:hypothetical protein
MGENGCEHDFCGGDCRRILLKKSLDKIGLCKYCSKKYESSQPTPPKLEGEERP